MKRIALLVGMALGVSFVTSAKTLTWKLAANVAGSFTAASSWEENDVPAPGDTLVFPVNGSKWQNDLLVGTGETFDLGTEGLTIDSRTSNIKINVKFTGSGKIVQVGTGGFGLAASSTCTGNLEIQNGSVITYGQYVFGTGSIDVSAGKGVAANVWNVIYKNPIRFLGDCSSYIACAPGQMIEFQQPVSSEHDLEFNPTYGTMTFSSSFSAPGHVFTVNADRTKNEENIPYVYFKGLLNASVRKIGNRGMYIQGDSRAGSIDNGLSVEAGFCEISANGRWPGTNVVVNGSTAILQLRHAENLPTAAVISVLNGGKVDLGAGTYPTVKELKVGGVPVADGVYGATDLPEVLTGTGALTVSANGGGAKVKVWTGGASGLLSEPSNWNDNAAPQSGDYLFFGSAVTLEAETFDIGVKGFVIDAAKDVKLYAGLSGAGKVVKRGAGALWLMKESGESTHGGGTRIENGVLYLNNRYGKLRFGTGPVEVVATPGVRPYVYCAEWDCGLTNALVFIGENTAGEGAIGCHNPGDFGSITADSDIRLHTQYETIDVSGPVSMPGKTLTVRSYRPQDYDPKTTTTAGASVRFYNSVDANIYKIGTRNMELNGVSTNPDNTLTLTEGTNIIAAAGVWAGTNIVLRTISSGAEQDAPTLLKLNGNKNLSPNAVIRVAASENAKINIASGVKVAVAELHVDGVQKPAGLYSAANLPNVITGAGKLRVGTPGVVVIFR